MYRVDTISPSTEGAGVKTRLEKTIESIKKNKINCLTASIVSAVLILSPGILLMGERFHPYLGSRLIILGSGILYVSMILLVFFID